MRGETVTQIARWRYYEDLGYDTIVERLNADPDRYPFPEPPGGRARARGAWSKSTVCDILRNPKYTGYQVFNRRGTRSKRGAYNDPVLWVWSPEPTHEPLMPKWMHDELTARRNAKRGSRDGDAPNTHPATRRTYLLRGRVLCFCQRRMTGAERKRVTYYKCWPKGNNRGRPQAYAEHPKTVYIGESAILDAVSAFYADRVFGPDRRELFAADLATSDDRAARQRDAERERWRRTLADLTRRQDNLIRQAQDSAPDDPFARRLRESYNDLEQQRTAALEAIAGLDAADAEEPARPSADAVGLLDALPYVAMNLTDAPEPLLQRLFELTQLTVRLHADSDDLTLTITLPADYLPDLALMAERITTAMPAHTRSPLKGPKGGVAVGAAQGAHASGPGQGLDPPSLALSLDHGRATYVPVCGPSWMVRAPAAGLVGVRGSPRKPPVRGGSRGRPVRTAEAVVRPPWPRLSRPSARVRRPPTGRDPQRGSTRP
ncbi:recombinase family protein [Actinacidiphila acididurans]|uniref:recombinase family protein n=1 Tax=Actinacidiphila acididurans TaxID=2784346 RepID=UPI00224708E9